MNIFKWLWKTTRFLASLAAGEQGQKAWWIRIITQEPNCTYYFGPFDGRSIATEQQSGFIEDLELEGAKVVTVNILFCYPSTLTIEGTRQLNY
ncbi:DUF1816 domain-containing protein [Oscillatoria sp. CS-180]|uniref:DUF1816 domain-containing protein n=1 Tax=Oscillatoria sp. CS-180 TaxID=3021720 RepID=UPI0023300587|nr:DUF1816 domain-containing protein [Oscillatoria sp. CS-180]MDB9526917.1 DUF1816 domain-containing protein [Oscillatoria sp. CS-180]